MIHDTIFMQHLRMSESGHTDPPLFIKVVAIEELATFRAEHFVTIDDATAIIAAVGTLGFLGFVVSFHFS